MGACCATETPPAVETAAQPKAEDKPSADAAPSPPTEAKAPPIQFTLKVEKTAEGPGSKVGLDVTHAENKYLKVKKVKEGLVEDWNKGKDPFVQQDDYIVGVNGVVGKSEEMLAEIKKSKVL